LGSKAQYWLPSSVQKLVVHRYYTLSYNEEKEQANWVAYKLTKEMIEGRAVRKNDFREDPSVETGSAKLIDYKGSGYDRGHLCPAAAMKINAEAMSESFYLSNMSPQVPAFNRGKWKSLETKIRKLTLKNDSLYVVTGPIFKNSRGEIGPDKVCIPGYYFKVIYFPRQKKSLAYLMPNCKIEKDIDTFIVPLDSIERFSNIHFDSFKHTL
jgi:endonuclease G